jgi:hypothetical protein
MIQYIIAAGIGAFLGSQSKKSKKSYAEGGSLPSHSVWEKPITQKERDKEQERLIPMSNKKLDFYVKTSRFTKDLEQKMENLGISSEDINGASYPNVWYDEGVDSSENFKYGSVEFTYKGKEYFAYGHDVFISNDLKELLDKSDDDFYAKGGEVDDKYEVEVKDEDGFKIFQKSFYEYSDAEEEEKYWMNISPENHTVYLTVLDEDYAKGGGVKDLAYYDRLILARKVRVKIAELMKKKKTSTEITKALNSDPELSKLAKKVGKYPFKPIYAKGGKTRKKRKK